MTEGGSKLTIKMTRKFTLYPRDVFISHAGPDKVAYARRLNLALQHRGISTWLDEAELTGGESLVDQVGHGLDLASLVVLLVTPKFLGRSWPETELKNSLAKDIETGERRIIPVLDVDRELFVSKYPLMRDVVSRNWSEGVAVLADNIFDRFGRYPADWTFGVHPAEYAGPVWTRITPSRAHKNERHEVTIVWGSLKYRSTFEVTTEPLSLVHHKIDQDQVPLQVHVSPDAIVTFGRGRAPDDASVNIDEGWTRLAGAPIV